MRGFERAEFCFLFIPLKSSWYFWICAGLGLETPAGVSGREHQHFPNPWFIPAVPSSTLALTPHYSFHFQNSTSCLLQLTQHSNLQPQQVLERFGKSE